MPVNRILRVERDKIVVSGKLSNRFVQDVFKRVAGSSPVTSVYKSYSNKDGQTTINVLPYHTFILMPSVVRGSKKKVVSCGRRLVFPGALIDQESISKLIVDKLWMPVRKQAKRDNDDLMWVVVLPFLVRDKDSGKTTTEVTFSIETYDENSKNPRGCKPENVDNALDKAAKLVLEELCKIIEADEDRCLLEATHVLNDFSATYAAGLEKALMDLEQEARFAHK